MYIYKARHDETSSRHRTVSADHGDFCYQIVYVVSIMWRTNEIHMGVDRG